MDIVPHVPHLHGLPIQFMKMHIDEEPELGVGRQSPTIPQSNGQTNGHVDGNNEDVKADDDYDDEKKHDINDNNGLSSSAGVNGFTTHVSSPGQRRPSTYI